MVGVLVVATALRLLALDTVPPGFFYDEAANIVDARFVLDGERPIFFAGNHGREPLFIYLQAASLWAFGEHPLAGRFPSAVVGVVTVALTYALGRRLFDRQIGLIAAALVAGLFWHVSLSRLGFRVVLLPLCAGGVVYALERFRQEGRLALAVAAGVGIGIAQYTYLAARVVPLLAILTQSLILLGWPAPVGRRRHLAGILLSLLVAAVVFAPLGWYFLHHPAAFNERAQSLGGWAGMSVPGASKLLGALGMLVVSGDPQARHNLPNRPVFDPLLALAFAAGLGVAVARRREPAPWLALLWSLGMLAPMIVAPEPVHFLRAAGSIPFLVLWPALAVRRLTLLRPPWRHVGIFLVWAAIAGSTALCAVDYFGRWARDPATDWAFEGSGRRAGVLAARLAVEAPVWMSSPFYRERPTYLLFARPPLDAHPVSAFHGGSALVLPPPGTAAYLVLPSGDYPDHEIVRRLLQGPPIWDRDGVIAYRLDGDNPRVGPSHVARARFGSVVELRGYDAPRVARAGDRLRLTLYWRVLGPTDTPLTQFNHVLDYAQRERFGTHDAAPFPSSQWRGGEEVVTWFDVEIDPRAPTGAYWLQTGFYDSRTLERLPAFSPDGQPAGDRILLGPIKIVSPSSPPPPAPRHPVVARLGEHVLLLGYDLHVSASGALIVDLYWSADGPVEEDYTVFLHLADRFGRVLAQHDGQPLGGANPTSLWLPGEVVVDRREVALAPGAPAGTYRLLVGMYDLDTGQRLAAFQQEQRLDRDQVPLQAVVLPMEATP